MELKITKEKVLEAASKCGTAKNILETLFPEVFVSNEDLLNHLRHLKIDGWIDYKLVEDGSRHKGMIAVEDYQGKTAIFLHADYDWKIHDDCYLIPTKKPNIDF